MNKLLALLKVNLLGIFDLNTMKKKKVQTTSLLTLVLIFSAIFVGLSVFYNLVFISVFKEAGLPLYDVFHVFGAFAAFMVFFSAVVRVKAIFVGKDYEMLQAMPIKKSHIVGAKLITLYVYGLLFTLIILLPTAIITFTINKDILYLLGGILYAFLLPALPILVASLVSIFISLVADRWRFGNLFQIIAYIAFFVLIMLFSFGLSFNQQQDPSDMANTHIKMVDSLKWVCPINILFTLSFSKNISFLFIYIIASVIILALALSLIALLFDPVHNVIVNTHGGYVYKKTYLKKEGCFQTLLKNETRRLFGSKMYFLNTSISSIIPIILCAALFFSTPDKDMFKSLEIKPYLFMGGLIIIIMLGTTTPAAAGINIEGANFWLVKSLPINYRSYALAKTVLSILVLLPGAIISSLLVIVLTNPYWWDVIYIMLLPIIYSIFASDISLYINLHIYKLKWKNEMEAYKNSRSVLLTLLVDWGVSFLLIGLGVGLAFVNPFLASSITFVVIVLMTILFSILLWKNAPRLISKIEDF